MKTVLVGTDDKGAEGYYTGRAGLAFVSADIAEAYGAWNSEGARNKARMLNRMTRAHGWTFKVKEV